MHVRRARARTQSTNWRYRFDYAKTISSHACSSVVRHGVFDMKYWLHTHLNLNQPTYIGSCIFQTTIVTYILHF
jgi:hypothetical protein